MVKVNKVETIQEKIGFERGFHEGCETGKVIGEAWIAHLAWHFIDASVEALEKDNEERAITLLRIFQYALADATGRKKEEKDGKIIWQKD